MVAVAEEALLNKREKMNMKKNIMQKIGIFSFSLLIAAVAAYLYSPVIKSHADESETVKVNAEVPSVLSMNLYSNKVTLERGDDSGNFATGALYLGIDTNSKYGYSLYVEDLDENAAMINQSALDYSIASDFSGTKTSETMGINKWGYSLDEENYLKMPVFGYPTRIRTTNGPANGIDNVDMYIGAKVGSSLPAGHYVDHVIFTAVANGQDGEPVETVGGVPSMQKFECPVIEGASSGSGGGGGGIKKVGNTKSSTDDEGLTFARQYYTLRDERDGKTYKVALLADGKCWMLQNLDITNFEASQSNTNLEDYETTFSIPTSTSTWNSDGEGAEVYKTNVQDYGTYYNYNAASAGDNGSICPANWYLPSEDDWSDLFYYEQSTYLLTIFNKTGMYDYDASSASGQGEIGAWWVRYYSPVVTKNAKLYTMNGHYIVVRDGDTLEPSSDVEVKNGYSIRCVMESSHYGGYDIGGGGGGSSEGPGER